ncbi:MAG: SMP-30/gluconolactonase/LRE family protein [Chloroflexi bacterium]|nr:SMP-30/gluconolactonase/LRE family protein [Chloroflexota bacterium]
MAGNFDVVSDELRAILGPNPELLQVASGFAFTEGACYLPIGDFFVWSDIPNNRIWRWSERDGLVIFREPTGHANGNTVDRQGRLLSCETSGRKVTVTEPDGRTWTLVDRYLGRQLTSPNDIVVKSDGSIWFTDPDYGALVEFGHHQPVEQARNRVYRFDPATSQFDGVVETMDKPNGLAFSPDESVLYVSDSGRTHGEDRNHHVMAFDVVGGRRLARPRVLAEVAVHVPDGLRVDAAGNIYVTAGDGVQVFDPTGRRLGAILTPEVAANCAFGGPNYDRLLICATSTIWIIQLQTQGARRP